jgi:hypothetical protein
MASATWEITRVPFLDVYLERSKLHHSASIPRPGMLGV